MKPQQTNIQHRETSSFGATSRNIALDESDADGALVPGALFFTSDGAIELRAPEQFHDQEENAPMRAPLDRSEVLSGTVTAHFDEQVGNKKWCVADGVLYANGYLVISTDCTSKHPTEGLRAQVFAVCVDDQGRVQWASDLFQCSTCGATWDPTTPSRRRNVFSQSLPEPVGRLTSQLHIYAASGGVGDTRKSIIDSLKFGQQVYDEIKKFLPSLA